MGKIISGLSIGMALLFGILWYNSYNKPETSSPQLVSQLKLDLTKCQEKIAFLSSLEEKYAFLTHPQTKAFHLSGSPFAPNDEAIFYYNSHLKRVYCNPVHLSDKNRNHQYQIWADINGHMENMGLLKHQGSTVQELIFLEGTESINITLEPLGGSKEPTLDNFVGIVKI